jgi:hypothetical protein
MQKKGRILTGHRPTGPRIWGTWWARLKIGQNCKTATSAISWLQTCMF